MKEAPRNRGLDENLSSGITPDPLFDQQAAAEFITALGLDPHNVHFRAIHWDKNLQPGSARATHVPPGADRRGDWLEDLQRRGYRLYWLPNGGPNDSDVTECSLLFNEWDDQPIEWQLAAWKGLGLPMPTAMATTGGKSVHCYWRLAEPITPDHWRQITQRLIHHCKSDPTCKNPSRLMRLVGSSYIYKSDDRDINGNSLAGMIGPERATLVESNPDAIYPISLFEQCLPELPAPRPPEPSSLPLLDIGAPPASTNGSSNGSGSRRPVEEFERLVAAYPTILADNDQREEAMRLICGLIADMEDAGHSRAMAIQLAGKYHPQAVDTFRQFERTAVRSAPGSFIKQCKAAGVDVHRHDLQRPVLQPPEGGPFIPQEITSNGNGVQQAAPWEQQWPQGDPLEQEDAAAEDAARLAEIKSFQDAEACAALVTPHLLYPPGIADKITQYATEQQLAGKGFYLPIQCAVASVIGNRVVAVAEVGSELKGIGVLWGLNMAPVSGGKSPTSKPTVVSALLPWHIQERDKHAEAMREWKRGLDKAEEAAKAPANSDIVGGDDDPVGTYLAENPQPERRHILTTDCTFEKLEVILSSGSTPGVLVFNDEMGRWFSQLTRKPTQSDREKWVGLYPGSPGLTDRIQRQEVVVANPAVSLFGNLQPARMAGLWAEDQKQSQGIADADGLWSRFLVVNLPEWDYTYRTTTVKLAPVLETLYRQVDRAVEQLPRQGDAPYEIQLDPEALELFAQWTADLLAMRKVHQHEEDHGFIDKQRGGTLRLALVLHAIDCASRGLPLQQPISATILRAAIAQTCLFMVERDQLLGAIRGGATGAIKRLLAKGREWRAQHGAEPVPLRQVREWGLPERRPAAAAVRQWLRQVVGSTPGCGSLQEKGRSLLWVPPGDQ